MTSPGRGARRPWRSSPTISAPSPKASCARWPSPIFTHSTKPNAAPSHSTACAHIGVDEHRHDRGLRDGAVVLHATLQDKPLRSAPNVVLRPPRRRAASDPRRRRDPSAEPRPLGDARQLRLGRPGPHRARSGRSASATRASRTSSPATAPSGSPAAMTPRPTAPPTCGASSRRAAAPRPSRSASATASGPRRPTASSRPRRCCARRASSRRRAWSAPADLDRRRPGAPGPPAAPMVDRRRPGAPASPGARSRCSSASPRSSRTA